MQETDTLLPSGLYIIWLSDTHYYGGRAKNIGFRWKGHLGKLQRGVHSNLHMQAVFNLHGRFEPQVLCRLPLDALEAEEQGWLNQHWGQPGCVNISKSAEGWGGKHSEASKAKMRARVYPPNWGDICRSFRKGHQMSPETRRRISEANKGRVLSEAHRAILVECNRGRVYSPEIRRRMSEAHMGHVRSPESIAKQVATFRANPESVEKARASLAENSKKITPESIAQRATKTAELLRGRTQTPESVEKRAAANRGRKNTDETKQLMSESAKKRASLSPTVHDQETRALISAQQKGRIWINDGTRNQRLPPLESQALLDLQDGGWSRGRFSPLS